MKKKLILISLIFVMALTVLSACDIDANGSIKSITKPYITEYECVEGYLGGENLLDSYEFIKISLVDDKEMQVSFKPINGEKRSFKGFYEVNPETREISAEIGLFGVKFREKITINKGTFVITKNILTKTLLLKFKAV